MLLFTCPAQLRATSGLPTGCADCSMNCLMPCSRTLGLREATFPLLSEGSCRKGEIRPGSSIDSIGAQCGGTRRSSVCQRPFFASRLPESSHRPDKIPVLTMAPAPDPDMTSKIVRDAQPKPVAQDPMKIHPAARAARAEAMPQTPSVTQPMNDRPPMNYHYRRSEEF